MIPVTMADRTLFARNNLRFVATALAIVLVATFFRFYGQDWDQGHYFHPDERFIATVMDSRLLLPSFSELSRLLDPDHSPLNTRSVDEHGNSREFAYGSLPFLLATFIGESLGALFSREFTSYTTVGQFGRSLTAIVDIGTIIVVMLTARRFFGELSAAISGFLLACSVILIQLAHFFTVDSWVTFFVSAAIYASFHVMHSFSTRWCLAAGAFGGAALATKASVGVLGIPILVAFVIGALRTYPDARAAIVPVIERLLIAAIPTVAVFAIFEPYAIWRPRAFYEDIHRQWEIVNGIFDIPFTRQFVGTTAGINEVENLILWGMAPGFGVAALIGVFVGAYWVYKYRDIRYILILSWLLPYFYVIASSEARFLRYAAPLVPVLSLIVGHQLQVLWERAAYVEWQSFKVPRAFSIVVITGICATTFAWAIAFMSVYTGTHPRIAASEWIYDHVESDAVLTREIWDDTLPVHFEGAWTGQQYQHLALDLYADREHVEAFEYIANALEEADYIVLASQRLSESIPRSPWRYPVQSAYYQMLDSGELGFDLAHTSTNFPQLFGLEFNTLRADESFSVYDHPPVKIYTKTEQLNRDELELRFAHALNQPWIPERYPPRPTLLLDQPISAMSSHSSAEWSSSLTRNSMVALVVWILTIALIAASSIPVATRLFAPFPDHGLGLSLTIGLAVLGIIVWLPWSFGYAPLSPTFTLVALAITAILCWSFLRTQFNQPSWKLPHFAWLSLIAFVAGFSVTLILRSMNPDLWHPVFGGERPMETAYLNALLRSQEFPPFDPWFADGYLNYYYYGFFLTAIIIHLTGVPSDIGFQLALATFVGMLCSGVFSLSSAVGSVILRTRNIAWIAGAGGAGVVFVTFIGNLDALHQIASNRSLRVDFWESSRVVEFAINEFPYFSLLYGDLHPHLMAAPFLVLVLALGYAWIRNTQRFNPPWLILWIMISAITVGSIIVINFWDGPTAGIILLASLAITLARSQQQTVRPWLIAGIAAMVIAVSSWYLFHPFHVRFWAPTDGLSFTSLGTSVNAWGTHFGILIGIVGVTASLIVANNFTELRNHRARVLLAFALVGTGVLLSAVFWNHGSFEPQTIVVLLVVITIAAIVGVSSGNLEKAVERTVADIVVVLVPLFAGLMTLERPVGAFSLLLVGLFVLFWCRWGRSPGMGILAISGVAGAGLILVADLVYVADHLQNSDWERMNTVFKLYFQAWTLLAIPGAIGLVWITRTSISHLRNPDKSSRFEFIAAAIASILVLLGVLYPILATPDRLQHQMESTPEMLTLHGNAWMREGEIQNHFGEPIDFTGDYDAIRWLNANAEGLPVILEASIGPYRGGGSRISAATGLPTVIGWESHQGQQRDYHLPRARADAVRELYRTTDLERKHYLLRQYNISFVVVGDVERLTTFDSGEEGEAEYYSDPDGIRAFDEMIDEVLEIAFESHNTRIYKVRPISELSSGQ